MELVPDRAYLAFDRLQTASNRMGTPQRFVDLCRRIVATNSQDWRARLALARHRQRRRRCRRRHRAPVRGAHSQPARAGDSPGDLEGVLDAGTRRPSSIERYLDADEGRRLLSRPARLRALPLPEHRAALAVPAMPRVEHVHRRAHRARKGRRAVERVSALDCRPERQLGHLSVVALPKLKLGPTYVLAATARPPSRSAPRSPRSSPSSR